MKVKDFKHPTPRYPHDFKIKAILVYSGYLISKNLEGYDNDSSVSIMSKKDEMKMKSFNEKILQLISKITPSYESVKIQKNIYESLKSPSFAKRVEIATNKPLYINLFFLVNKIEGYTKDKKAWIPDLIAISLLNFVLNESKHKSFVYKDIYKISDDIKNILARYLQLSLRTDNEDFKTMAKEACDLADDCYSEMFGK